jgi:hypothetical protein
MSGSGGVDENYFGLLWFRMLRSARNLRRYRGPEQRQKK